MTLRANPPLADFFVNVRRKWQEICGMAHDPKAVANWLIERGHRGRGIH